MDRLRLRKRLVGWIACFAMLLNALAPAVSHAVAAASDLPPWLADFCTTDGPVPASLPQSGGAPPLHLDHCPYCLTHAASFALPGGAAAGFAAAGLAAEAPPGAGTAPGPSALRTDAQPRAPPAAA